MQMKLWWMIQKHTYFDFDDIGNGKKKKTPSNGIIEY